ncbi:MAG: heparinase II/III family protein [Kiritimatiellae bacterium]|nr:heparinase II/III family protein [Kiritimatiellia bacterium]
MKRITVRQGLNRALMLGLVSGAVMSTAPAACAAAAARQPFTVEPGHPRIFFTAKDLPALRKRIETTHAGQWRGMKNWADGNLGKDWKWDSFTPGKDWKEATLWFSPPVYAFLYRLSGEKKYADAAISMAKTAAALDASKSVKGDLGIATRARAMSLAYDWCYDRLTAEDKAAILKGLDAHANWLLEGPVKRVWHPLSNHRTTDAGDMGMAGLAMHGDHPNAEKYIAAALSVSEAFVRIHRHFSGPGDGMAGAEGGSMEYTRHALLSTFLPIEAFRTATGNDLFVPELQNFAYGLIYGTYPDKTMLRQGDGKYPGVSAWERKYLSMLASRYRNPHAQWYVNHMTKPETGNEAWYDILWYDPSVPETPPDALPLARHFQGAGVAVIRTGWYEPDATVVSFKCGNFVGGHNHYDQNSFTLYRKGHLALDAGGYDSHGTSHYVNYYERTVAHNSITVFDPDEEARNPWHKRVLSNDGGQLYLKSLNGKDSRPKTLDQALTDPKYDTGDIVVFEPGQGYVRVLGDATRAYSAKKLKKFTRQLVVLHPKLKANPPTIVVFDRVQAARPEYTKKWLLHTVDKPEQVVPGAWCATEGAGTLYVRMLEPQGGQVSLVGGPGHEFEVNGRNYPLSSKLPDGNVPGAWRIEVEPPKPAERDLFLNVLMPVDKDQTAIPAVTRLETANMLGGFIRGDRGEPDTVVWFARERDLLGAGESLSYRLPENGETRHLIADLPANVDYAIRLNGRVMQTQRTQDTRTQEGVRKGFASSCSLAFTTPGGAGGTVTIAPLRR